MPRAINDSVVVFVDAANVWEAQKAKGRVFDYEKLKIFLEKKFKPKLVRIFFYTAYPADGTRAYSLEGKHKFYTYYNVRDTGGNPDLVLVGAGLTVDSCIEASEMLKEEGIDAKVINVVNPNSLNKGFGELVAKNRPLLTVYNGHPRVLRQSVADALLQSSVHPSVLHGLGFTTGKTGTLSEMLSWSGLNGRGVYDVAKRLL